MTQRVVLRAPQHQSLHHMRIVHTVLVLVEVEKRNHRVYPQRGKIPPPKKVMRGLVVDAGTKVLALTEAPKVVETVTAATTTERIAHNKNLRLRLHDTLKQAVLHYLANPLTILTLIKITPSFPPWSRLTDNMHR